MNYLRFVLLIAIAIAAIACTGDSPPASPTSAPTQAALPTPAPTSPVPAGNAAPLPTITAFDLPIFDTHVHYSQSAWADHPTDEILARLARAGVTRALFSSSPDDGTRKLYELAPDRIVPELRPYYDDVGPGNWFEQEKVRAYLTARLKTPIYKGIGELHLSVPYARSPIAQETARLALANNLVLHVHSDAQTIRELLAVVPEVRILWAHSGLGESPSTIRKLLDDHKNVWADTALRESEIASGVEQSGEWRALLLAHPDRFMVGTDTWVPSRWDYYEDIIAGHRRYLALLPRDLAERIAFRNATELLGLE